MSAFSPWDTGPPGYIPSGSSRIFTNTGGAAPPWNTTAPDYPPSFDEPRRSSHFFTYSDPHYRTRVDEARSTARSGSDLNEPRVRPRHAHVYDGHLEADVGTGKMRVIQPRATTSASTSRRYSSARSAVLPEAISTMTRSTADPGSRVTYATAVSHMSSRLTYATASSRISRVRSDFASQSSSTISYCTASSSNSHRTPSSATVGSDKSINNLSEWKRYLLQKGLIPNLYEELNWSGRGQYAEYEVQEKTQIPLASEGIIGHPATAIVDKVKCRRILLARKTIRCSIRMKRNDAAVEVEHLQKLKHIHIIRIVGTYVIGNKLAILLYPVAEWNLETFLEEKPLSMLHYDDGLTGLLACFPCLANAVEFLHANTVKHMDIKPQNILIKSVQGHVKVFLADFGIARSYTTAVEAETDSLTPFTRRYAAPEVVAQERRGLSADIFSLGCVFTEILSHFRQSGFHTPTIWTFWDADDLLRRGEKNAFHPSEIQNFSYSSNIDKVVSFLREQTCLSTRSWIHHAHPEALSFLGSIRGLLIRMLSPTPSLRPSAREVAEQLQTPNFALTCNCGHESPPFEIAPPGPPRKTLPFALERYFMRERYAAPEGYLTFARHKRRDVIEACVALKEQFIILLWADKVNLVTLPEAFTRPDEESWIKTFCERVEVVGTWAEYGLWLPDRAPACHQSRPLLTQLASRKCRLLVTRSFSRKSQLLLTWPSGAPVVEEGEESEDEVIFEGRR